jgi:hypothetical protein
MLNPTELILIFLVSKPIFTGLCLLIIATRSEPAESAAPTPRALPAPTPLKRLPHHE